MASLNTRQDCLGDITNLCVTEQHEMFFVKTLFQKKIFSREEEAWPCLKSSYLIRDFSLS